MSVVRKVGPQGGRVVRWAFCSTPKGRVLFSCLCALFHGQVRLRVPAGTAKPGPAIGQALGPLGLNMMEFCKAFNAETANLLPNTPMQVGGRGACYIVPHEAWPHSYAKLVVKDHFPKEREGHDKSV